MSPEEYDRTPVDKILELLTFNEEVREWENKNAAIAAKRKR